MIFNKKNETEEDDKMWLFGIGGPKEKCIMGSVGRTVWGTRPTPVYTIFPLITLVSLLNYTITTSHIFFSNM